jgi:hypothetical protein
MVDEFLPADCLCNLPAAIGPTALFMDFFDLCCNCFILLRSFALRAFIPCVVTAPGDQQNFTQLRYPVKMTVCPDKFESFYF